MPALCMYMRYKKNNNNNKISKERKLPTNSLNEILQLQTFLSRTLPRYPFFLFVNIDTFGRIEIRTN